MNQELDESVSLANQLAPRSPLSASRELKYMMGRHAHPAFTRVLGSHTAVHASVVTPLPSAPSLQPY